MQLHLAFDGGGSKLSAIVYDDEFNLISQRKSGGTNARFLGDERVARNSEEAVGGAIDEAFAATGKYPTDAAGVVVGPSEPILAAIAARTPDCKVRFLGEAYACRLAGAFDDDGCIVIAGTGSGVAWISGRHVIHRGGYGPELGDEGGGYWIGQRGLRAAIAAINGWGVPTALAGMLMRYVNAARSADRFAGCTADCGDDVPLGDADVIESMTRGLYRTFYSGTDTVPRHSRIAGFAPYVGEACDAGDSIARAIIHEAGVLLARQTAALYRIYKVDRTKSVALCGGAWQASKAGALGRAFREEFAALDGGSFAAIPVTDAILPPVAAGAVLLALSRGTLDDDRKRIINCFSG